MDHEKIVKKGDSLKKRKEKRKEKKEDERQMKGKKENVLDYKRKHDTYIKW